MNKKQITVKELKSQLDKLNEDEIVEFKTTDNKKLLFYGVGFGGVLSASDNHSLVISQSVVLKEV